MKKKRKLNTELKTAILEVVSALLLILVVSCLLLLTFEWWKEDNRKFLNKWSVTKLNNPPNTISFITK